jgi:hypothetical protein
VSGSSFLSDPHQMEEGERLSEAEVVCQGQHRRMGVKMQAIYKGDGREICGVHSIIIK